MANVKFNGNPVNLMGTQVKVGEKAPSFELVKNDMSPFKDDEVKGKVVIYSVVPSIDTEVCSLQTKFFNKKVTELSDDVIVVTVSEDLPFAQGRFCAAEGIDRVIVASDYQKREFGMNYGFLMEGLMLLARGIVVVDKDGIIQHVEYVPEVTNEVDFDAALSVVKGLV
ncbi:MAG: thiol peroxidase [Clostridiales bacterium]|nr:thiol peroxidase [Clostridiales bacterium]MDD7347938.1 thiol peroxidase [Clostridiales bacterium]MDY4060753.1 thiol peroxidase [Anaerovoracaceae bacterium]